MLDPRNKACDGVYAHIRFLLKFIYPRVTSRLLSCIDAGRRTQDDKDTEKTSIIPDRSGPRHAPCRLKSAVRRSGQPPNNPDVYCGRCAAPCTHTLRRPHAQTRAAHQATSMLSRPRTSDLGPVAMNQWQWMSRRRTQDAGRRTQDAGRQVTQVPQTNR